MHPGTTTRNSNTTEPNFTQYRDALYIEFVKFGTRIQNPGATTRETVAIQTYVWGGYD